ncbi:MAG: flagellar basal body P-ring formation protein FlgA [Gammaproteobacteria bacterium]|nr:flagellar basal body P-ring formation protein FlgA [Gammaproteobacteria bacterium]
MKGYFIALYLLLGLLLATTNLHAAPMNAIVEHAHESVQQAVRAQFGVDATRIEILPLNNSLRLRACDEFTTEVKSTRLYGKVPVRVSCTSPIPWSIYVSAQVDIKVGAVVASQAVARGQRLTRQHLEIRQVSLTELPAQPIKRIEDAMGKTSRRSLVAGRALNLALLTTPHAVRKGERVHIESVRGGVHIQTYGVALNSGFVVMCSISARLTASVGSAKAIPRTLSTPISQGPIASS